MIENEADKNGDNEISLYKKRLKIALSAAKMCVFEVDLQRQLYTFFENAEAIFNVSGDDILNDVRQFRTLEPDEYRASVSEYFSHPDDAGEIGRAFACILEGKPAVYEARMKAGKSNFVWCRINVTPIMENGRPVRMIGAVTDITDIKLRTDSLTQAVNEDHFTGLYNKVHAISVIQDILNEKDHLQHALVLLDIDNFKSFNDTYGHDEGDIIIKKVSRHIKNTFRKTDVLGRFGGDEFIILVQNVKNGQWLYNKLQPLLKLDNPACTSSIGVSFFPQDADDFNDLFKKTDRALYHAKSKKGSISFFSEL